MDLIYDSPAIDLIAYDDQPTYYWQSPLDEEYDEELVAIAMGHGPSYFHE